MAESELYEALQEAIAECKLRVTERDIARGIAATATEERDEARVQREEAQHQAEQLHERLAHPEYSARLMLALAAEPDVMEQRDQMEAERDVAVVIAENVGHAFRTVSGQFDALKERVRACNSDNQCRLVDVAVDDAVEAFNDIGEAHR